MEVVYNLRCRAQDMLRCYSCVEPNEPNVGKCIGRGRRALARTDLPFRFK